MSAAAPSPQASTLRHLAANKATFWLRTKEFCFRFYEWGPQPKAPQPQLNHFRRSQTAKPFPEIEGVLRSSKFVVSSESTTESEAVHRIRGTSFVVETRSAAVHKLEEPVLFSRTTYPSVSILPPHLLAYVRGWPRCRAGAAGRSLCRSFLSGHLSLGEALSTDQWHHSDRMISVY